MKVVFRVLREAVRIFLRQRFAKVLLMVLPGLAELWIARSSLCWLFWKSQKCTEMPKFGGGSDRNRALLGEPVHDMQMAQGSINTGYFASC
jgi:hypothetical protein